jgi:phospholipase/lecithinase/hemolysin
MSTTAFPTLLFSLLMLAGASEPLGAPPARTNAPYSALYVFGDSLSATTEGWYWNSRWSRNWMMDALPGPPGT